MDLFGKKINFLGDSITEGCGVALPENRFVDRIAAQVGAICRNYGIGGTRIARQQVPSGEPIWDLYFASRVEDMEADADLAVVFGGTNDCGHGDAPLGTMEDRTEDTFYGGLHVLYSASCGRVDTAAPPERGGILSKPGNVCEDRPGGGWFLSAAGAGSVCLFGC